MPTPFDMSRFTPEQRAEYEYLGYVHQPSMSADEGDAMYRQMTGQDMIPEQPVAQSFGNYGMQMGPAYEAGLESAANATQSSGMPEFGSLEYQNMMGHSPMNNSKTLPKFDPSSGADWMRGIGLFAKGAILGAPKQAGPAPTNPQSQGGGNVSKESTYNQGDYWGWLFNS
jgi:hypothetical protein